MNQATLSKWLKVIIIGISLCGLVICLFIFPSYGKSIAYANPEFSGAYFPWLIFLWISALPCYSVLIYGWKICSEIGNDNSFSHKNFQNLKIISALAVGDSLFFFVGNLVLLFLNMNHPGIVLVSLIIVFVGFSVAVVCAALSYLVHKATLLKEENEKII